ncbi:MAG: hypothetical protein LBR50_06830 [Tannerella sp.]|nr:hypothetical protein [Tannerella sp.]
MTEKDNFGRACIMLIITWIVCGALFFLPDRVSGYSIKKVDMLSEVRVKDAEEPVVELFKPETQPVEQDDTVIMSLPGDDFDAELLQKRDSMYVSMIAGMGGDSANLRIRDFSAGHTGLARFFAALNNINDLGRPVRIAFLGDSFIEGDILVADFRSKMQSHFGGRGVGFVPVASHVEQYRPTIRQQSKGWETHSILTSKKHRYVMSGLVFNAVSDEASLSFKNVDGYPGLKEVSSVKFIYSQSPQANIRLICNDLNDTITGVIEPTDRVGQFEATGMFTDGRISLTGAQGLQALGIALEDNEGVVVDNFSLRGNSGTVMTGLDEASCREWISVRPYDLIIIQYGLNVAREDVNDYTWYRTSMVNAISHLQECFPKSDILLLGVSDRSYYHNGAYRTMPSVKSLLNAQYKTAEQMGLPFWSIFHAMGGEDSMVKFVKNRWASKDYTHLSFRGGREIASALFDALILEKKMYDEVEGALY